MTDTTLAVHDHRSLAVDDQRSLAVHDQRSLVVHDQYTKTLTPWQLMITYMLLAIIGASLSEPHTG